MRIQPLTSSGGVSWRGRGANEKGHANNAGMGDKFIRAYSVRYATKWHKSLCRTLELFMGWRGSLDLGIEITIELKQKRSGEVIGGMFDCESSF